jgi:hypothetical protein
MVKNYLIVALLSFSGLATGQQKPGIIGNTNWAKGWSEMATNKVEYPEATTVLMGNITTDKVLTNTNTYRLSGKVCVTNGATLTIEAGTIIRGDVEMPSGLVIAKGSKIKAEGSALNPIIFTSNKPDGSRRAGDWDGIIIMGEAPLNVIGGVSNIGYDVPPLHQQFGGAKVDSDSGIMKYVRIEYAGRKTEANKEQNALTLAGVGNKTKIEFVQVSLGLDDGMEVLGGNVVMNNIISYQNRDDDFDFNLGAQVSVSNSYAIRNAYVSGNAAPRCMEVDSYENKANTDFTKPVTSVVLNNVTLYNESSTVEKGLVKEAVYVGDMAKFDMKLSVVSGFSPAVKLSSTISPTSIDALKGVKLEGLMLNNCSDKYVVSELGDMYNADLESYYANFKNTYDQTQVADLFYDTKSQNLLDLRLKVNNVK